jgi:hypothetical protein
MSSPQLSAAWSFRGSIRRWRKASIVREVDHGKASPRLILGRCADTSSGPGSGARRPPRTKVKSRPPAGRRLPHQGGRHPEHPGLEEPDLTRSVPVSPTARSPFRCWMTQAAADPHRAEGILVDDSASSSASRGSRPRRGGQRYKITSWGGRDSWRPRPQEQTNLLQ